MRTPIDRNHPLWHDYNTKPYHGSARLTILVAKEAPVALVIRRQPSKRWTFFRWDLGTNGVTEGGSYEGIFWSSGCDISWDGQYWAYYGFERSGICRVPEMQPVAEWENDYGYGGACLFNRVDRLQTNIARWHTLPTHTLPLRVEKWRSSQAIELARLARDGWRIIGKTALQRVSPAHPKLLLDLKPREGRLEFSMPEVGGLIDRTVFSATYISSGDLLVAWRGYLIRYDLEGIRQGRPTFWQDLNLQHRPQ